MIDLAKLVLLLNSVSGDCYLGKETELQLVQDLREQVRVGVAQGEDKDNYSGVMASRMRRDDW